MVFCSFHPYLFFNQDHVSVTFLGFKITRDGNLVDPTNGETIERGLMTKELRNGLAQQRVNFDEDYNSWSKLVFSVYCICCTSFLCVFVCVLLNFSTTIDHLSNTILIFLIESSLFLPCHWLICHPLNCNRNLLMG